MEKDNAYLGTEPVGRLLLKLAVPTVIAQIVNLLYNLVDRIYIGHIPEIGSLALTGLGLCTPIILVVSAFAALVSSGGAPRASIFMGKGDFESAEKTIGGCFTLQVILSLVLTAVLRIWNRSFLLAFGASENTIGYASDYMNIYALGTIFVQLTLGMNAFITAQGFARTGMFTVLIGAVLNIVLDPIFIFALDMGVQGAALATICSQAVSTIWVVAFVTGKRSLLRLKRKNLFPGACYVLPCIGLGFATFIMQASESIISVCFNASLQTYGGDLAVGAMTILSTTMQFAFLPLQGVAQGAQPIIGYNFGAKNAARVKKTFFVLLRSCLIYSITVWAMIMLLPGAFAGIFTDDSLLASYAAGMLRVYCAVLFMFGAQIACQMTFVSIGSALSSIIVAVTRKFILLLPLIYLVPNLVSDHTLGVYLAEPIADFIAVTFTVVLFSVQFRKTLKKLNGIERRKA